MALQERYTTSLMNKTTLLIGESDLTEMHKSLSLSIDSIGKASKFSVVSEQVHSS